MNLTGQLSIALGCDESLSDGLDAGSFSLSENVSLPFLSGTGAGQCDLRWSWTNTLAVGGSDTWTLSALVDALGRAVALARVNYLLVETGATVDGDDLAIGGAATHPWAAIGGTIPVKSLGVFCLSATNATGLIVSAGSSDQLKIANASSANPITYRIALIGRST